jgi:hypothetical protein
VSPLSGRFSLDAISCTGRNTIICVAFLVIALTLVSLHATRYLPPLISKTNYRQLWTSGIGPTTLGINVAALVRMIDSIRQPIDVQSGTVRVSARIGVASFPQAGWNEHAILKTADKAMYQAKTSGKNRYQIAD